MDLAGRGVQVVVAELRRYAEPPNVKCNHVSARTMEQFRRLGVAHKLRDAGLPARLPARRGVPHQRHRQELTRIPIPCRRDRYTETEGPDAWWPTPEPPHRINQIYLEPILLEHTAALPNVTLLNRTQVTTSSRTPGGVTATALDLDAGHAHHPRALPGGLRRRRSPVRKQIGAQAGGHAGDPARAVHLDPRAQAARPDSRQAGLVVRTRSTRAAAARVCHRRARDLAGAQPPERPTSPSLIRWTATGRSARSWAWAQTLSTRSSARKTGWAAAWWPTASATATCSSAATPRTCGCPMPATA
jgi:2-polyprenyl-6-methoxyphenol hydroxylase-like FAD-dependent oxidoreductase